MRVEIEVPDECIEGALYGAFDSGGVYYWAEVVSRPSHTEWAISPMLPGFGIKLRCTEEPLRSCLRVTSRTLRTGLYIMSVKAPKVFAQMVAGDYDANVGDVLVQCIVFGEVVYG